MAAVTRAMTDRTNKSIPDETRRALIVLLTEFELNLERDDLREQVRRLVDANLLLRDLGISLPGLTEASSARERILLYLKKHVGQVLDGRELMVVSGISEYARRIRELRVQFGWQIISGMTLRDMQADEGAENSGFEFPVKKMRPDEYLLVSTDQDRELAYRWQVANELRKQTNLSARDKLLKFFRDNVGRQISGEELRYVCGNTTEWARRTRELRTEFGWPVTTKSTGRPDLPVGIYVLESDRQLPAHDRRIRDETRRAVLRRDGHRYRKCGWSHEEWNPSDPRHLEAHHLVHHAKGGDNSAENLITLCNVCHDAVHSEDARK